MGCAESGTLRRDTAWRLWLMMIAPLSPSPSSLLMASLFSLPPLTALWLVFYLFPFILLICLKLFLIGLGLSSYSLLGPLFLSGPYIGASGLAVFVLWAGYMFLILWIFFFSVCYLFCCKCIIVYWKTRMAPMCTSDLICWKLSKYPACEYDFFFNVHAINCVHNQSW